MGTHERIFRFKQFSLRHEKSAMKIGMDGVLLGAWADVLHSHRLLDVGCGCGLIAAMCAQRSPGSTILAIDIDQPSVEEAILNFDTLPWKERMEVLREDYLKLNPEGCCGKFDHIISNPPFFDSGVDNPDSARLVSRHASVLSPLTLISHAGSLLVPGGRISMVMPPLWLDGLQQEAATNGLKLSRLVKVVTCKGKPCKRILVEYVKTPENIETVADELFIYDDTPCGLKQYSREYKTLTGDFYLQF